jgi:hypothetical protein
MPAFTDTEGALMTIPPEYSEEELLREQYGDVPPAGRKDAAEREIQERDREEQEVEYLDPEDNEAHAPGQVCARCKTVITASQDARRLPGGQWIHEVCPPDLKGLLPEGEPPSLR